MWSMSGRLGWRCLFLNGRYFTVLTRLSGRISADRFNISLVDVGCEAGEGIAIGMEWNGIEANTLLTMREGGTRIISNFSFAVLLFKCAS